MTGLVMDIRTALRAMVRRPLFTLTCVVTLAVGIGSTTSIFTVVNSVLLRSLPYQEPHRLVRLNTSDIENDGELDNATGADFLDWKAQSTSFSHLAGYVSRNFNLTGTELPIRVRGASVTPEFFPVFGRSATLGRALSPDIDRPGNEPTAVLSDGFWRSQLGADPAIVGRSLRLNGVPYTVVGVMPPDFVYPSDVKLWTSSSYRVPEPPLDVGDDPAETRAFHYFDVIGRLEESTGVAEAQNEMTAIADRLAKEYPETNRGEGIVVRSLRGTVIGDAQTRLLLLLATTGFVLLIACINVAGMLLTRATERSREIALRLALGAENSRIVRQFLTESMVLAFAGGIAGVALATWGTRALLAIAPDVLPRTDEVTVDLGVLAFTILLVVGTSIVFGLAPAAYGLRRNRRSIVNEGRGGPDVNDGGRLRTGLVVAEVAATLLLVIGTGLMVRTFINLNAIDPGFEPRGLLAAHVALPDTTYREDHSVREFQSRVLEKLRALPGVESASTVLTLPMHWNLHGHLSFSIDGRTEVEEEPAGAGYQVVGIDYFETMRIPLLKGRLFEEGDDDGAPLVALVNQTAADRWWPNEDPVGKRVSWHSSEGEDREWVTIVGIVDDVYVDGLDTPPRPETYRPFAQDPFPYMTLVLRTQENPTSYATALRLAVADVDPNQPVSGLSTMEDVLETALTHRRFNMLLMGIFAGVALLLAAVGLYGMLSFSFSRRRREIGIRRALGALPRDIAVQFITKAAKMIAIGLGIGLAGALALARLISTQLHEVSAFDLPTYVVAMLILTGVGLLASYLPAWRASRVDPATVLRSE